MSNHDEGSLPNRVPFFEPCLYIQRYQFVSQILHQIDPKLTKVADFGCAEGRFLRYLKKLPNVREISCIDADELCLEHCIDMARPIMYDYFENRDDDLTINIYKGSVAKLDSRLSDYEAVTMIELVEHLHDDVLSSLPSNIFGFIKPKVVIVTTPNIEFNVLFPQLKDGGFRHYDHKFEFTRQEFKSWCDGIISEYPEYNYELTGVGRLDNNEPHETQSDHIGFCTQIAIFRLSIDQMNKIQTKRMSTSNSTQRLPLSYDLKDSFHYPKVKRELKEFQFIHWDSALHQTK